jgi:hypothetical protein
LRQKLHQILFTSAAPLLQPGEQPVAAARGRAGHVSVKANMAMAAASAVLSGGSTVMTASAQQLFILLTDRRLLVLPSNRLTFRPVPKVIAEIPREAAVVSDVKRGFMTSFTVSAAGQGSGLRFAFPRTERTDAETLLAALGVTAAA